MNKFMLNETSYHGAGAIKAIPAEIKARGFKKAFVCSDPDLIKFGVTQKVLDVLDKNGQKIWENDIVWVGGTDRAVVIFSEKYSGYILQPIGDFYFDSPMLADNVDIIDNIIGTIFDNPELLKDGE